MTTARTPLRDLVNGHIVSLLDERDMTAPDLAEGVGMGALAVRNRLSGLSPWTVNEVAAVADLLEVNVVSLFRE